MDMRLSDSFHIMVKPTGAICNLGCEYCFYLEKEKLYPSVKNRAMPDDVLEKFIKEYIQSQNVPVITFAWQGGEPTLLGIEFFKKVIQLEKKYADGRKLENAFQTNGILLNDEWCSFFSENNFLIGLSIDGPMDVHNKYRVLKGGLPSFDKVMAGLEYLKKYNVEFNTLTCVQKDNSYKPFEVYEFLKEIGSGFMQFIPVVERESLNKTNGLKLVAPSYKEEAAVTDWSVESIQYGKFLMEIFNQWVRNDVGKYYVQIFDVSLGLWHGLGSSLCVFRETCGQALAMEHNGDVYSCDHFVYPENKLGNIMEESINKIVDSQQQFKFASYKKTKLPQFCIDCDVHFACNGECPKNRFIKTPGGEDGLNYLCSGYKYFFHGVAPYMKFMSNELSNKRSPANVMNWAKEKDKGFPGINTGRNDPCICGSGFKFKDCCGINRL
jgi:uncharacterized protein